MFRNLISVGLAKYLIIRTKISHIAVFQPSRRKRATSGREEQAEMKISLKLNVCTWAVMFTFYTIVRMSAIKHTGYRIVFTRTRCHDEVG